MKNLRIRSGRRRPAAVGAALLTAAAVVLAVPSSPVSAEPVGPAPEAAPTTDAALTAAETYGQRVEALSERTEFSQVFAEPTGQLRYEAAAVPQFVHHADGSWADIDMNLKNGADGLLRPVATLADVRFSGGGDDPLVKLVRDGETMTMSWPLGDLPKPSVSGDSATYAEVLPDVDLVVRATRSGFTHVVVVKSADAATNPKVREIRFDLGGDAKVRTSEGGSLQAVTDTALLAHAEAPQMWDSRRPGEAAPAARSAAAAPADTHSNAPESTHEAPGDAAQLAPLQTEIDRKGDLILRPDEQLLGADAKFPVFIDPEWDVARKKWAYATNNNSTNTDTSVARVGADPQSGKIYRSFFEFPTADIAGKYVRWAYVQMGLDHSYSCDPTWTHIFHSGVLTTPRTNWSTRLITHLGSQESNANEDTGCSDSPQPDQTRNFIDDNITTLIRGVAEDKYSTITFGFSAGNAAGEYESSVSRWKKWFPDKARLIADIDAVPGTPTDLHVNGVKCQSGLKIGNPDPYFTADLPDGDGTDQKLTATWEFKQVSPAGGTSPAAPPPSSAGGVDHTAQSNRVSGLVGGRTYAFRVKGTDPAPYNLSSDWSPWCQFTVDSTVPPVTITELVAPTGAGTTGKYRISSTATDVTTFRYGWTEAATTSVPAGTISGVAGKAVDVEVTVPTYGINDFYAQGIDATLNKGVATLKINVPRPRDAVARWAMETTPATDRTAALADRQNAAGMGNPANTPLTATGVTWKDKGRTVDAENIEFAGGGVLKAQKFLDTSKSFSAAAWVKLDNLNNHQSVISQDGVNTANFQLMFRTDDRNGDGVKDKSWCFGFRASDNASLGYTPACVVNTVVADRWTHIAGTYDAVTKKAAIWVNGVLGPEVAATGWAANGSSLRIGNSKLNSTTDSDWLYGSVVDAQVFDRVLVQGDFVGKMKSDTTASYSEPGILESTRVGMWGAELGVACFDGVVSDITCVDPDGGSGWSRRLGLSAGVNVIESRSHGNLGLHFDDKHYTDDPYDPYYGQTTTEYAASERNTAKAGEPQNWQQQPVLRTDTSFTVSAWLQPERLDMPVMTAVSQKGSAQSSFYLGTRVRTVNGVTGPRFVAMAMQSNAPGSGGQYVASEKVLTTADTANWSHVVFVYDVHAANKMRLFVNGRLVGQLAGTAWNADGPMVIGNGWWSGTSGGLWTDQWHGGIDNVQVYQGAMSDARVAQLNKDEAKTVVSPLG